jgi:hypothetical protein
VHYADAAPLGTRIYRDSLPKVQAAVATMRSSKVDFMIELGDFKDTDVSQHCDKDPSPACIGLTVGFLRRIESAMAVYTGPKYHILGNHDVDILNQSIVLANEHNAHVDDASHEAEGYYSFSWPPSHQSNSTLGPDTAGCLTTQKGTSSNIWIVHKDGTRNWISAPTAGCRAKAVAVPNIEVYPKRHGAQNPLYALNTTASAMACSNPKCAVAIPAPPPPPPQALRFIALNGDYTDTDVAWKDLDLPFDNEAWDKANVPSKQMEWLAAQVS